MYDYKTTPNVYIVHTRKNGNEASIGFDTLADVADYVEKEGTVTGVWRVTSMKIPPEAYTRMEK